MLFPCVWAPLEANAPFILDTSSHVTLSIQIYPPPPPPPLSLFTFSIFDRSRWRFLLLLFPPPSLCLFLLYLCIYAHRSWPKVNRRHTIAHSTGSTVIQPSGQDLSQTGNDTLNHWVLSKTQTGNAGQFLVTYTLYLYAARVLCSHVLGEFRDHYGQVTAAMGP